MKFNPQINSLIQEIAGLCYQIKCAHGHDVFCDWSPHVEWVSVRFFIGSWADGTNSKPFWRHYVYVNMDGGIDELATLRDILTAALKSGAAPEAVTEAAE